MNHLSEGLACLSVRLEEELLLFLSFFWINMGMHNQQRSVFRRVERSHSPLRGSNEKDSSVQQKRTFFGLFAVASVR